MFIQITWEISHKADADSVGLGPVILRFQQAPGQDGWSWWPTDTTWSSKDLGHLLINDYFQLFYTLFSDNEIQLNSQSYTMQIDL